MMRDDPAVRTTLDLDEDVLLTAKEMASARGLTAGQIVSELARKGLAASASPAGKVRNGVPLLARRPGGQARLTMRRVNELRDEP
jgi:hypothetical protein